MSSITIGQTESGKACRIDLDVLLRTRLLIQANSGKGKSWLLRRIAEQLFGKVQVIIVDPEGEFATLRERYDYVLVGKGGETAAHPRIAAMIAQRILELRACAVCDLYEMKPGERHAYVKNFLEALIDAPKTLWHPLIVIVDEAHVYCPEKGAGESEASEAMIGMATRGRKRGYCLIAATQRLGKFRKDAASELLNVGIGGTFIDIDRKRAADALGVYGQDIHPFFDEIRLLERGKFYFLGPAISTERVLVQVGAVETTHPEAGSAKHAAEPPPTPTKIKALLPSLADLPKEAEEKAKNIADLQKQVRDLKAELRQRPTEIKQQIEEKIIEVPIVKAEQLEELASQMQSLRQIADTLTAALGSARRAPAVVAPRPRAAVPAPRPATPRMQPARTASNGDDPLPIGERAVLIAVAQFGEVERDQLTVLTGYKRSSRDAYVARLAGRGYLEIMGKNLRPTQGGIDRLGNDYEPLPTGSELYEFWRGRLPEGELKILEYLWSAGVPVERNVLDESTGYKRSSRDAYLSRLAARRLVEMPSSGMVQASPALFD